jgi:tetratricopeptide (TPR) repeat protein
MFFDEEWQLSTGYITLLSLTRISAIRVQSFDCRYAKTAKQGNFSDALQSYSDGLAIRQRLAKAEPENIELHRNWAESFAKLAEAYRQTNDPEKALAALRRGRFILDSLLKLSPDNDGLKLELSKFDEQIATLMN